VNTVDGDLTSLRFTGTLNETNSPAYHDQRAPVTPTHPQSKVVSTGCFQNSFLFSFFRVFRRRSTNDHEVDPPLSFPHSSISHLILLVSPS
jgi:hypothetical protein